jgi:hypothetical protein
VVLAIGASVYLLVPAPLAAVRGLALGLSLLPLWDVSRRPDGSRS